MTYDCRRLRRKSVLQPLPRFTWWSFFDLLGYSAAHCPVVGSPDGTEQGNETLFSQEPLGGKYSNYILENMRRKKHFPTKTYFYSSPNYIGLPITDLAPSLTLLSPPLIHKKENI